MDEEQRKSLEQSLERIAHDLNQVLNKGHEDEPKTGFVLLVFPYDDKSGRCSYASNGTSRHDLIRMFKFQINKLRKHIHEQRHDHFH
jgi:hypothetical protein